MALFTAVSCVLIGVAKVPIPYANYPAGLHILEQGGNRFYINSP